MKVKIKRIDKTLPLPVYHTNGSVGFDFLARETVEIAPKEIKLIPANVVVKTPPGYMLLIASRSSTPSKKGLIFPHGVGVLDQDYSGDKDEVLIQVYNILNTNVKVERGERIAQGVFVRVDKALEWEEVDEMGGSRGGIGSTGD